MLTVDIKLVLGQIECENMRLIVEIFGGVEILCVLFFSVKIHFPLMQVGHYNEPLRSSFMIDGYVS